MKLIGHPLRTIGVLFSFTIGASFTSGCGADKTQADPYPDVATLQAMEGNKACLVVTSHMQDCSTEFVRTLRVSLTADGDVERAISAGRSYGKTLETPPAELCSADENDDGAIEAYKCLQEDCELFAACMSRAATATRASGEGVPECAKDDMAYEAVQDGRRGVWCVHANGIPHGPWWVWEGKTKRVEGQYVEGLKEGEWKVHHDGSTETQRYVKGEDVRERMTPPEHHKSKEDVLNEARAAVLQGAAPAATPVASTRFDTVKIRAVNAKSETNLIADEVQKRIENKYLSGITRCHHRALKTDPKTAGAVSISFTVGATGRVTKATAKGFDPSIDSCLQGQLLRWRFRAPTLEEAPTTAAFGLQLEMTAGPS